MLTLGAPFLRSLLWLASLEDLDALLDAALVLIQRDLAAEGCIELWYGETARFVRGVPPQSFIPHTTWIGVDCTIGVIRLEAPPADLEAVKLIARQLAPLAERAIDRHIERNLTVREDIDRLYERRIRWALMQRDWNVSAVARELSLSRTRVTEIARRYRKRSA